MSGGRDVRAIERNAAAAGLRIELPPDKGCEVWPENWTAKQVAERMLSQINAGMAGAIGLRYEALPGVMDLLEVPADERLDTFDAVRVIEAELLRLWNH